MECMGLADRSLFDRALERVRDAAASELFRTTFDESRRLRFLQSRRNFVKESDLRFFLGVLLNAHRREDVLTLVRSRMPDQDPAVQVAAWIRRLANTNLKLQVAAMPWQPNVLGLPEMNDDLERTLADMLMDDAATCDESGTRFMAALRSNPALSALFG